jgi:hypothetical protein
MPNLFGFTEGKLCFSAAALLTFNKCNRGDDGRARSMPSADPRLVPKTAKHALKKNAL